MSINEIVLITMIDLKKLQRNILFFLFTCLFAYIQTPEWFKIQ